MTVPVRYILAAIAFGVAALGFFLLPVDAAADCNGCTRRPPPSCQSNCNPAPPPPPRACCQPPTVVVPPPHVPPPNIVVVNAGARAAAHANATAIAIANVRTGDTIIRQNMVVEAGASAAAAVTSTAMSVTEGRIALETRTVMRDYLVQAICLDERGNPHPASQTFGGRDVAQSYSGEIYRCMSGTRMRYTINNQSHDCAPGEALWYEGNRVECRPQIERRPCNERSLLRRYGPGDKLVRVRETETLERREETTFSGAMTMDGGVGGVY